MRKAWKASLTAIRRRVELSELAFRLVVYRNAWVCPRKREEQTVEQSQRVKSVEGTLTADDLQQLQAILDNVKG